MAIYHCSVSNVSRAKGGSSCATLAYISGARIYDDRTGETYSYSRKERILEVGTILPVFAPAEYANAETLFKAIEKHETNDNARTAKKIQVALPRELELAEQKEIIEAYIRKNLAKEGYCATYAIHDGGKKGNVHAHILVTNRPLNSKGEWAIKSRKNYARDENGNKIPVIDETTGKQKVRIRAGKGEEKIWKRVNVDQNPLDTKDFLLHLRKAWAEEVNRHLEPEEQIDHRSNADRGIKDVPTVHEGYAARGIEEHGGLADRCEINRYIRRENEERRQNREQLDALEAKVAQMEKEEREEIDRVRAGIARRKRAISATVGTCEGRNIGIESQRTISGGAGVNHPRSRVRDFVVEAEKYKFDETEREITRISKKREEVARRERETAERKRQFEAEFVKREQQINQLAKTDRKSNDHTLAR
jgi:hypothetical protein